MKKSQFMSGLLASMFLTIILLPATAFADNPQQGDTYIEIPVTSVSGHAAITVLIQDDDGNTIFTDSMTVSYVSPYRGGGVDDEDASYHESVYTQNVAKAIDGFTVIDHQQSADVILDRTEISDDFEPAEKYIYQTYEIKDTYTVSTTRTDIMINTVELNGATFKFNPGAAPEFTGTVPADSPYAIDYEQWESSSNAISSSAYQNFILEDGSNVPPLEKFESNDEYRYSVSFNIPDEMYSKGYRFSDNLKLIVDGKEFTPPFTPYISSNSVLYNTMLSFTTPADGDVTTGDSSPLLPALLIVTACVTLAGTAGCLLFRKRFN